MTEFKRFFRSLTVGIAVFALTLTAGCDGGGSSSGEEGTGSVAVLVTDAPTRDFLEFRVTVSSIDLIGRRGHVNLTTQESEFDLLRLENLSRLFSTTPEVPAGVYSKIRLTVKRLELIDRRTRNSIFMPLNGAFKIDLKPRLPFEVAPNSRLVVEIDIDARRSVRWRSGQYRFRPVVRVKVGVEQISHLVEVRGVVNNVDLISENFEICRVNENTTGVTVTDECLTAQLSSDSSIFNPDGVQGTVNDLVASEVAKVVGHLDANSDSVINVKVVERDALAAYVTLYGSVLTPTDVNDLFELTLDADQDATADPVVDVQLQAGTRVFDASGTELDTSAVATNSTVETSGVLAFSPIDPDTLWAEWVIVSQPTAELDLLTGFVLARTDANVTLFTDTGNRCVRILPDADIHVVTESSTGTTNEVGELTDLVLGREVDLEGTEAGDGCFEAQTVTVFVIAD